MKKIKVIFKKILDLVFPNVCGFCNILSDKDICNECAEKLKPFKISDVIDVKRKKYDKFMYVYLYKDIVRNSLINFKFYEQSYKYKAFAYSVKKTINIRREIRKCDMIIPIPMHISKYKKRGYNQSELIARELSKTLHVELDTKALIKIRDNKIQSTLTKQRRKVNVNGAYSVIKDIRGKTILLIDDIYTTGSTIDECSKVLKKSGVDKIFILIIAKD